MKVTLAFPPMARKGPVSYGFWSRLKNRITHITSSGKNANSIPSGAGKGGGAGGKFQVKTQPLAEAGPKIGKTKRKKHPTEESFISKRDYGKIVFEFKDKNMAGFVDEKGDPLRIHDLYEHFLVLGGSGTGKTYSVLQPLWEEWFRSTHLPDGEDRENLKFGALVIEAKGDFRDKTWALAQKYGRMDDVVFFGPTHRDVIYDMFGDPTESPLQLANKMLAMLKAFSGGSGTQDPFWDNAARKLFQSIFIMHRAVKAAETVAENPAEKDKYKTEPMSFHLLNLMLMDRGQPRNQSQVAESQQQFNELWSKYQASLEEMLSIGMRLSIDVDRLEAHIQAREDELSRLEKVVGDGVEDSAYEGDPVAEALNYEDEMEDGGGVDENEEKNSRSENESPKLSPSVKLRTRHIRRSLARLLEIFAFTSGEGEDESFSSKMDELGKGIQTVLSTQDDMERGRVSEEVLVLTRQLGAGMRKKVHLLDEETSTGDPPVCDESDSTIRVPRGLDATKEMMIRFIDASSRMSGSLERLSKHQSVQPAMGALKTLLGQYEEILRSKQVEPQLDTIWAYFSEEYLNIANEKTAGSVAMVATNLVSIFVHPPYSEIFASKATFNFNMAIDEGKIVYLDMPSSYYGAAATVAAIAFKIDFFRCMLSRPRLSIRNPDGTQGDRVVNQERPMSYFCDEFASIVSTGDETGEAGFMDKVREFKCGCLLGTQSIPMLLKKISEHEVDAILTNTACKLFLRNTDVKTNEYASKILGSEIKVNANLNQGAAESIFSEADRPIGTRPFSTNYSRGARFDVGEFTKLQKGQAIVVLNPRFGRNQIQKLSFKGKAIPAPDQNPPWNLPSTHPY
jgi:type IV secretory pathway TraG/TraD family ATPase VirD4